MDRSAWLGLGIGVALIIAALAFYRFVWLERSAPTEAEPIELPMAPDEEEPAPVRYPLVEPDIIEEDVEDVEVAPPLPPLEQSDDAVSQALGELFGPTPVTAHLIPRRLIERVVTLIDNLDSQPVGLRQWPVRHIEGVPEVEQRGEAIYWDPGNEARYRPYVRMLREVDAARLTSFYVIYYPLFQQAYAGLGYPDRYFNDRLIDIIDHLIAAPEVEGPFRLVQPKVLYRFADPQLEALSWGQKQMIRLGPENAAVVRAKLREIRAEIIKRTPAATENAGE
jgi:hypothetical protein